jgi:hypothetical protein
MAYTTIDKPTDYFNTVTWSGDDTSPRNITGVGFQPDWIWGKARSRIGNHWLIDSVRGSTGSLYRVLNADDTATEQTTNNDGTTAYGIVTTIGSDGFTIADGNQGDLNVNNTGDTYVAWNWLAGGSASSNSNGSITSSVSANTTAGFSIVSYTGTGSASTVGHGLSSTPQVYIIKNRSNARNWQSYHEPLGNQAYLRLNTTGAASTGASIWNNTSPTSSVFSIGTSSFDAVNSSGDNYIAYCFAEKKGYSKFGSYTGNGNADGTFVYTGFKPAFLIQKRTDASDIWRMFDNKRLGYNVDNNAVAPNSSGAEGTGDFVDLLSNGFKFRSIDNDVNGSGNSYIYMSFAENPFVTSTGIPACAR